jgi:energy-coupling factor transport system ATP-binding protein
MGIHLQEVSYTYQAGTPFEGRALFGVDLEIVDGSYTALIGHTGSGKSTILQLLNGLNIPTSGSVIVDDMVINATSDKKGIKQVRKKVGLVFQFPESQVFDETVLKDVAFGPQNFGISQEEAEKIAREKLALVGISEELFERSPFELSGGQMRRVAIAGILAMEPNVLVLDEPTAGLDPAGRQELMDIFKQLHANGMTIVLVTHLMDDVANYADWVYVMEKGKLIRSGKPRDVFQEVEFLETIQLGVPKITKFAANLERRGFVFERLPVTIKEFAEVMSHGTNKTGKVTI